MKTRNSIKLAIVQYPFKPKRESTLADNSWIRNEESNIIPEELLPSLSGQCGRWQISVIAIFFLLLHLHSLTEISSQFLSPRRLDVYCKNNKTNSSLQLCNENEAQCKIEFSQEYGKTIKEKWFLLCRKELFVEYSLKFGLMVGYFVFGKFADKYGRKKLLFIGILTQVVFGCLQNSDSLTTFLANRFIFGVCSAGVAVTSITIVTEIVGNKWRTFSLGILTLAFVLSFVVMPAILYLLPDNLQLVLIISLMQILFCFSVFIIHDSPNWLCLHKTAKKAEAVIIKVAKYNGYYVPSHFMMTIQRTRVEQTSFWLYKLIRSKTTRWNFLSLITIWLMAWFSFKLTLTWIWQDTNNKAFLISTIIGSSGILCVMGTTGLLHIFHHKWICLFFNLLANGLVIADALHFCNIKFKIASNAMYIVVLTTLLNTIPRNFSTDMRASGIGFFLLLAEVACIATTPTLNCLTSKGLVATIFGIFCVVTSLGCINLWNVHNRELPDLLTDTINFRLVYKPLRYTGLKPRSSTLDEVEVNVENPEAGPSQYLSRSNETETYRHDADTSGSSNDSID